MPKINVASAHLRMWESFSVGPVWPAIYLVTVTATHGLCSVGK